MSAANKPDLGIMYRREHAPESLPEFARKAEALGFDELYVVEDCFYGSGVASAAVALAVTDTIKVGLGIMPAVVRNPVFTAMEIATLARMYPGRFLPGIGHGVGEWMRQIGAFPKSQLKALEEVTTTVRALIRGERVTFHGQHVQIDAGELFFPAGAVPPISLGVIGPKSLAVSGRVADGTILSEYASPAYVHWAREQIGTGDNPHHLTLFAFAAAAETTDAAHQKLRPMVAEAVASGGLDTKLAPLGILPQVNDLRETVDPPRFAGKLPAEWIAQLTIAGTPQDWRAAIDQFAAEGIHAVILVPMPDDELDIISTFARHLQEAYDG